MELKYILLPTFSIIAVVIGWLLNEIGFFIRSYYQDKRQLKEVLFNLLEIWHSLKKSNPNFIVDRVLNKLSVRYGISNSGNISFLREFYINFTNCLIINENISKLKVRHEESIKSLAQIDSLLAYKLSGKTLIYEYINVFNKNIDILKKNIEKENIPNNVTMLDSIKNLSVSLIIEETLKDIENNIKEIGKKISFLYGFRLKKKFKGYEQFIIRELDKELDKIFKQLEEKFGINKNGGIPTLSKNGDEKN